MISTGIGLLLLTLVSGDALVICGGDLAHIDTGTGTVTQSVGVLSTYPNDIVIHGGSAFVVNSGVDQSTLQKFEIGTWNLTELGIGSGWNCWASLPLSSGELAVTAALNNSITMVNPETMTINSTTNGIGPTPEWMAESSGFLYTACGGWGSGNSIVVLDTSSGTVTDTLTADTNCQSLAIADDGRLFVTCSGTYGSNDGTVVVIDPSTGSTIETLPVGGFPAFCVSANGRFYTSDPWGGGVFSVDMETLTVLHDTSDPFCTGGNGLAVDDQGYLWITDAMAGEVRVYDQSENLVHTYAVSNPGPIAVSGAYMGIEGGIPSSGGITVFPNPAVNVITVSGTLPGEFIRIYDISGRIAVEARASETGNTVLSAADLPPGMYSAAAGSSAVRFAVTSK